jgi:hypothetical protein
VAIASAAVVPWVLVGGVLLDLEVEAVPEAVEERLEEDRRADAGEVAAPACADGTG